MGLGEILGPTQIHKEGGTMKTYTLEIIMDAIDEEDFIGAIREMKDKEFYEHIGETKSEPTLSPEFKAFKNGVYDALVHGSINLSDVHRHEYKRGYDFGMVAYDDMEEQREYEDDKFPFTDGSEEE